MVSSAVLLIVLSGGSLRDTVRCPIGSLALPVVVCVLFYMGGPY
jgi:hypothetical protein